MSRPGRLKRALSLALVFWICAVAPPRAGEPQELPAQLSAYLFWRQGYALHLAGHYDGAVEYFRRSVDAHPTAEGHTYLGWSLSRLGRIEEAISECEAAIQLDPDYGNPYNDIGTYLIALGRRDEAVPWLEKAMRAKRYCCYQFPHFNLGRILLLKGDFEAAQRSFERALSYEPDFPPALQALELIRAVMGEAL